MKIYHTLLLLSLKHIYTCKHIHGMIDLDLYKMSNIPVKRENVKIENKIMQKKKVHLKVMNCSYIYSPKVIKKKLEKKKINKCNKRNIKKEKKICLLQSNNNNTSQGINITRLNNSHYVINNYQNSWKKLNVSTNDLQLKYCFLIGQEFCFSQVDYNTYIGLINKKIYLFKETDTNIFYQCLYDNNRIERIKNEDCYMNSNNGKNIEAHSSSYEQDVHEFFNLEFPLKENIETWKKKDKRMDEITDKIKGLRILKTDSVESFFSFLCSTNNNIPRITLMIDCLRRRYGKFLATVTFQNEDILIRTNSGDEETQSRCRIKGNSHDRTSNEPNYVNIKANGETLHNANTKGEHLQNVRVKKEICENEQVSREVKVEKENNELWQNMEQNGKDIVTSNDNKIFYENIKTMIKEEKEMKTFSFYEFPSIDIISKLEEEDLRKLGFGYRSSYVIESAKMLTKIGSETWIENLKKEEKTKNCIDELLKFPGIGLKVANCICLFGLNKYDCIPIDTHIYDIIYKYYKDIIEDAETSYSSNKREINGKTRRMVKMEKNNQQTCKKETGKAATKKAMMVNAEGKKQLIPHYFHNDPKRKPPPKDLQKGKQKKKALTTALYIKLFSKLKKLFGPNCGWAQTILFASELKKFSHLFR
ncbi:N-glycosylase/DNA lyase, putative [Plasmodium ovale]|uniref:DNA-(apurinic or apyrimidinic site) lyase n=2 Tax=Plasmodium ovale TaxID=36330 RepID=A0A1A8VXW6_PLAOA|nr:N-glycosylase/DNA lyase, putative (OGG1) [Plasmodium ovale curtisi]SCQ16159.1 N-glycosylase/DNA lyase, putative [Plasmodium ovale]